MKTDIARLAAELEKHKDTPAAVSDLLDTALADCREREDFLQLARLAEEHGLLDAAISAYNRLLELDPQDHQAVRALAELREERGETGRARRLLERLASQGDEWASEKLEQLQPETEPDTSTEPDRQPEKELPAFTDADLVLVSELFAGRPGVHARQWASPDGRYGYAPVMAPLTPALVRQHLLGACTLGVYPIDHSGRVRFLAFDIDLLDHPEQLPRTQLQNLLGRAWQTAAALAAELSARALDPLLESSGYKGFHVWLFFAEPWPARLARRLARLLAQKAGAVPEGINLEVFPAQDRVRKGGLGNLIKLPLGVHLKSSTRSRLLDERGKPLADPFARLRAQRTAPLEQLESLLAELDSEWSLKEEPPARQPGISAAAETESSPEPREKAPAASVPLEPPYDPEGDEQLVHLARHCRVLERLIERARARQPLGHQQQAVLKYTLGHLDRGPEAVNYLFEQAGCLDESSRLVNRLRGNAASCARIRRRLHIAADDPECACSFSDTLGHYPTPLLHLASLRAEQKIVELAAAGRGPELAWEYRRVLAEQQRLARLAEELERQGAAAGLQEVGSAGSPEPAADDTA